MYNHEFLIEVFKLQQQIEQLGQEEGEGLEKICFAPITYAGEMPTLTQCTVQSIFGYYGNSFAVFNRTSTDVNGFTVNYLDTIIKCTQYDKFLMKFA